MSKYLYATVYEEFTGLKPPEPTDNKQRRKRGYGHPYRMRLNMQEDVEIKQKKPERRNQFGQPIASRKNREEPQSEESEYKENQYKESQHRESQHKENQYKENQPTPQFNAGQKAREERRYHSGFNSNRMMDGNGIQGHSPLMVMPTEKSNSAAPKVTYKKRRAFSLDVQNEEQEASSSDKKAY